MRALKNDAVTLDIAILVVTPGITLTSNIMGRREAQSLEDGTSEMRGRGVPINHPDHITQTVVWLMGLGMERNGKSLLVQAGRSADLGLGLAMTRKLWMTGEELSLFRGGQNAPLSPNKLREGNVAVGSVCMNVTKVHAVSRLEESGTAPEQW